MRRRRRLAPLLRAGYRVAWLGITAWALVDSPRLRGVKCVLRDGEGRVLFVRHTYGDRRLWELPGGGAHRGETHAQTARREAREELGVDTDAWTDLGTVRTGRFRARVELAVLEAPWPAGAQLRLDPVEIAEAAWHAPGTPPAPMGKVSADGFALVPR
jgi:8-oxo-dGTP pyrophosphatase MutT (NUDIX family)